MIAPQKTITLRESYQLYKKSKADKPRTVESYEGALDHWERCTENADIRSIDDLMLYEFQQSLIDDAGGDDTKKRSNRSRARATILRATTANKIVRHIAAILNRLGPKAYGNPDGLGKIDAVPYVRPLPEDPIDPRTAEENEVNEIYRACKSANWPRESVTGVLPMEWWRSLLVVIWNLGLRRNDFLALKFSEIDLKKRSLKRKSEKTRKRKPKPLHPVVVDHLQRIWPSSDNPREYVFGLSDSRRQLYQSWYGIQEEAGLSAPYFTFHQIRKTCGTALYEHAPGAAQAMLEHSTIATTERYYANCDPILKRAVEKLNQPSAFVEGGDEPDDGPATIPFPRGIDRTHCRFSNARRVFCAGCCCAQRLRGK